MMPNLSGMGHHETPVTSGELEAAFIELDKRADELGVAHLDQAGGADLLRIEARHRSTRPS
jgi:hypothetical protein